LSHILHSIVKISRRVAEHWVRVALSSTNMQTNAGGLVHEALEWGRMAYAGLVLSSSDCFRNSEWRNQGG